MDAIFPKYDPGNDPEGMRKHALYKKTAGIDAGTNRLPLAGHPLMTAQFVVV